MAEDGGTTLVGNNMIQPEPVAAILHNVRQPTPQELADRHDDNVNAVMGRGNGKLVLQVADWELAG